MNLSDAFKKITTVILDIDGVMTDGMLLYGPEYTSKRFNAQDGHAIKMAIREGYKVGVISGRDDPVNRRRIEELGMTFAVTGAKVKIEALKTVLAEQSLTPEECLFVGDDVIDIPVMANVGIGVAVSSAVSEVLESADLVTTAAGGDGAVREVIVRMMTEQGTWDTAMARYYNVTLD